MAFNISADRFRFLVNRFRERLWVKPAAVCLLSIAAVFIAKLAEGSELMQLVPEIDVDAIATLLSVMASSMLVIATLSVTSMVSAYASASSTATPRSFTLVVADDASQNALSTFVGAFIFSIVALTAVKNDYFGTAGIFILFVLTALVFAVVIFTFVRWVDRIARLGRMGSTIDKVEQAAAGAMERRRKAPTLAGVAVQSAPRAQAQAVFATRVGYVQHIDIEALQTWAEDAELRIEVAALPGCFASAGQALAYVHPQENNPHNLDVECVREAFQIDRERLFDDDPRFALVVLSEIAGRALSPGVNDPGTAIDIIGTLLRLFSLWSETTAEDEPPLYDRVEVPQLDLQDMFDDAFTAIARDGAGVVEVSIRLQKALQALASMGDRKMQKVAQYHSQLALKRARLALDIEEDLNAVLSAARQVEDKNQRG